MLERMPLGRCALGRAVMAVWRNVPVESFRSE